MTSHNHKDKQGSIRTNHPVSKEVGFDVTWKTGDVLFDLYEVRPVVEGFGEAATEKSCHRGGFGQVYKVYHRGWNLELAMKVPLPEVFANEEQVLDFTRECETWVELGLHPHIVSCYYVRSLTGQPLVFAEYVAGGSLKDWIASGLLYEGGFEAALKRIIDISIQTARGLNYAHEQGLVHQDVKPANVMLTPDGQAKISDFGTARARARAAAGMATVSPGTILVSRGGMTPAYCSPEQALGEKLTRRTDIWSWGLTVLEMFTGEVTWASGLAAAKALEAYLHHGGESDEIPPIPHGLSMLLERCFKNEEERPQNFSQVAAELEQIYRACYGTDYPRPETKAAPDSADSLNNRALSMHDLGREEEAAKLWEEALKHDPAHLAATYNLGLIEWRNGRIDDVVIIQKLEELRKAQKTTKAAYLLAMIHAERFDYCTAVKLLEETVNLSSTDFESVKLLEELKPLEDKGATCLRTYEGHTDSVNSACLSADNCYILSGSNDKMPKLWDVASGECLRTLVGHDGGVNSVCLSKDKRYALSGSSDTKLKLWEVEIKLYKGEIGLYLHTFKGHTGSIQAVCISSDSRHAFSGSSDHTLKKWAISSGECLHTFEGHNDSVESVCLSVDNCYALSGSRDNTLKLWDVSSGECLRTLEGHTDSVKSVCLSADSHYALSGSWDNTLKLWDVSSGKCLLTFRGHNGQVRSVYLSSDNRYALSGSSDKTLKLWDVESGKCLRTLVGHDGEVNSVYLSSDNRYALSSSWDRTLRLWHILSTHEENKRFYAQLEAIKAVKTESVLAAEQSFSECLVLAQNALKIEEYKTALLALRSARAVAGSLYDRRLVDVWASLYPQFNKSYLIDGWCLRTLKGHDNGVNSVYLSADNRYALSGSSDNTLKLWDVENGKCVRTFETDNSSVVSVCLSSDGRYALSGSGNNIFRAGDDDLLKLWDVASGRCLRNFEGHTDAINSVCLSVDNRYAITGSDDDLLKLWDLFNGKCLQTFGEHNKSYNDVGVLSVYLSADVRYVISGSGDCTLKLWDIENGICLRVYEGHAFWVNSVYMSADNRYALSGSSDDLLKLWDVETGECLRTFEGHTASVNSVCLSADNCHALSGSHDRTLKLWEVASGRCLRTFEGHTDIVTSVSLSADCRFALSGSHDGTLKLWELYWDLEPDETK